MKKIGTYRQWQEKSIAKIRSENSDKNASWEFSCENCGDSSTLKNETEALNNLTSHKCATQ